MFLTWCCSLLAYLLCAFSTRIFSPSMKSQCLWHFFFSYCRHDKHDDDMRVLLWGEKPHDVSNIDYVSCEIIIFVGHCFLSFPKCMVKSVCCGYWYLSIKWVSCWTDWTLVLLFEHIILQIHNCNCAWEKRASIQSFVHQPQTVVRVLNWAHNFPLWICTATC